MLHRAGNVDGEGDGCGVLIDIPRKIWAEEVRAGGHASKLALDENFAVVHLFIPRKGGNAAQVQEKARDLMSKVGLRVLAERENVVDSSALGPHAREEEPVFWQVGRPDRGPGAVLRPHAPARGDPRRARRVVLDQLCRLQGAGHARGAGPLLPRPARPARRDRLAAGPQPLLDQHLAELQARAAVRRARPQRRDQHDRPPAPGGADARRAAPARRLGLAGPEPHDRVAIYRHGLTLVEAHGADAAADRGRGEGAARGPARLLHVPAPGVRARSRRARWR